MPLLIACCATAIVAFLMQFFTHFHLHRDLRASVQKLLAPPIQITMPLSI